MCVCNAVCPDETVVWIRCFRNAVQKLREGVPLEKVGNCDEVRRKLDACTQHASSKLLHAAVLPSDKSR